MVIVYGYATGCPACDDLKSLLKRHRIEYEFVEVPYQKHPFKTVPQTFFGKQILGGLDFWKDHLKT